MDLAKLYITNVANFRLNGPFMLQHPEGFWSVYGPGVGPKAQKSKNEKKHHKFTQAISLPNFRQI